MISINNCFDTSGLSRYQYRVVGGRNASDYTDDPNTALDLLSPAFDPRERPMLLANLEQGVDICIKSNVGSLYIICGVKTDSKC